MSEPAPDAVEKKPRRWGFVSAALVILALMVTGQIVGTLFEGFGPRVAPGHHSTLGEFVSSLPLKDWILLAFALSSVAFAALQFAGIVRFFRSMPVGVMLVALTLLAVMTGVLVPQIETFEDPTERVPSIRDIPEATFNAFLSCPVDSPTLEPKDRARIESVLTGLDGDQRGRLRKYRDEYLKFRWAEGYFIYHLVHPYGIGMPKTPVPARALEGLKHFAQKYGKEEGENSAKAMRAAVSGGAISTEIEGLIHRHEGGLHTMFDVCSALHLNRTYKSWWFATLMALLFGGVAINLLRYDLATLFSARKIGFATVHLGMMILLAGGAYSKWKTDRGIIHMDTREEPKNVYWGYMSPDKPRQMPFWLKLERFARRDWKTIEVHFNDEQFTSMPPQYTLWPGLVKDFDYAPDEHGVMRPRIRLEVMSVAERATVEPNGFKEVALDDGAADSGTDPFMIGPLASLTVRTQHDDPVQLAPRFASHRILHDPACRFRLSTSFGEDRATIQKSLLDSGDGRIGWLSIRVAARGDVEPTRVPIHVGERVPAPGGYEIEILRATGDFQLDHDKNTEIVDPKPLAEQYPANPAVRVRIHSSNGGADEERVLLERLDYEEAGLQKGLRYSDLVLNLVWDRWSAPGPERFVLAWDASGKAELVSAQGEPKSVATGATLALPGPTRVVVDQLFKNARFERRITLDKSAPLIAGPHFDATFYSTDPTGVQIAVTTNPDTPAAHAEIVTLASTEEQFANEWLSPDRRFSLRYFHNDKVFPFEWRSVLSVWNKNAAGELVPVDAGPEWDREIRVNDYFYYRGYRFFQTNAEAQFPTYSGIGVVYDPGIPFVLMGMYVTIVGAILAFLVRPLVEFFEKQKHSKALA